MTLVSIVTPTIVGREHELWKRCVPSVQGQDSQLHIEHIIVSDRNPEFMRLYRPLYIYPGVGPRSIKPVQINESWRNPTSEASIGAIPWHVGSLLALGEYVGFLGDDDELSPDHVSRHVAALRESGSDFSVSPVEFKAGGLTQFVIGDDSFQLGHLDADGIFCRASALSVANWSVGGQDAAAGDYRLVQDWLRAGLRGTFIGGAPTAIHHDGWVVGKTGRPDRPQ